MGKQTAATVSVTLDRRRQKKDGTFPLKLYVWDSMTKEGKFYGTKLSLSERDFHSAWETMKPRREVQPLKQRLQALQTEAQATVDTLEHFTFEAYERKALMPVGEAQNVFWHYDQRIAKLKAAKRIGTADSYQCSAKALQAFAGKSTLQFNAITPQFLENFETYMVNNGRSLTTVGIYLRPLRAIFNDAIADKLVNPDYYPFGRRKYVVPASKNTKKALSGAQLRQLMDAMPTTNEQARARDFFFFSFASNGMNMKDIALLRWEQLEVDRLTFLREKTKRTKKDGRTPVTVFLNGTHHDIIKRHGNAPAQSPYVFPIVNESMDAERQHRAVKGFTRYVNQHLEKLCTANKLQVVSTYWARHSFATIAVLKGASMEFMRESLDHSDMKTTLNYFAGFSDDAKKKMAQAVMDF
jgi:integrase/recombinase XerD